MRYFSGIDPGLDGSLAIIDTSQHIVTFFKFKDGNEQHSVINSVLRKYASSILIAIEDNHAIYRASASSTFSFGSATGYWRGVCDALQIPIVWVKPKEWQEQISLSFFEVSFPAYATASQKKKLQKEALKRASIKAANSIASRNDIRHDGIADAICIAEYLRRQHNPGENYGNGKNAYKENSQENENDEEACKKENGKEAHEKENGRIHVRIPCI